MTLAALIERLGPLVIGSHGADAAALARPVRAVTYDSRRVTPGALFVALPGAVADGNAFVPQAISLRVFVGNRLAFRN